MFELFRNQSRSATGAIKYVTVGVLMIIWAGLWYYYFVSPNPDAPTWHRFTCVGIILSGFAIGAIGLLFGAIGRVAKGADTTVGVASTPNPPPVVAVSTPNRSPAVVTTAPPAAAAAVPVAQTLVKPVAR